MKTRVVNINEEDCDIFIGRPSEWGNPFEIGRDGTRIEVINKYKEYILKNVELMDKLHTLRGKILGCFCKPKSCHGDVLVDLVSKSSFKELL